MRLPFLRHWRLLPAVAVGFLATGCGQMTVNATAYLTWQIVDAKDPNPKTAQALTCAQKGVAVIRVQLVPGSGSFDFPCASMAAETATVTSGDYTVQTIALDANYHVLAQLTFPQRLFGQTNLGLIIFQIP